MTQRNERTFIHRCCFCSVVKHRRYLHVDLTKSHGGSSLGTSLSGRFRWQRVRVAGRRSRHHVLVLRTSRGLCSDDGDAQLFFTTGFASESQSHTVQT